MPRVIVYIDASPPPPALADAFGARPDVAITSAEGEASTTKGGRANVLAQDSKAAATGAARAHAATSGGKVAAPFGVELIHVAADAAGLHTAVLDALSRQDALGLIPGAMYRKACVGYCSELSREALGMGAVSAIVRRQRGVLYGHNSDPTAFAACLTKQKVKRVRSALVLGAGMAARVALCALRDMGCARFMVGFRHPRRISELSGLFRDIRRQLSYFPLAEMQHFFEWAERAGVFNGAKLMPPPHDEFPGEDNGKDHLKRWDLLVNSTPLGEESEDEELVTSMNFLRCFNRVFDMVPHGGETPLVISAKSAGVPVLDGATLQAEQLAQAAAFWQREARLRVSGDGEAPGPGSRRRMEIRRQ